MTKERKEDISKYCLDLSKLVFGGGIVASIVRQDFNLSLITSIGGIIFLLLVGVGFFIKK
ncbi:MAG: ABC transporter permease [Bacteroidales bacterium]|jgi:hypothetical protein|nr:ABC transporter permease [Bacteroidales bacterium]